MIKRLLVGIFVVVCLVSAAGVWFIHTLDLNLHKEKIQQLVFERTGRSLAIEGEIESRLIPWIGLQLNDVSLANADGFDEAPFASAGSSDVELELLPLLSGNFNVKWVKLHELRLNLQVNEDGVANWEDLLNTTTVVETESSEEDVLQSVEAGAPLAAALSVGRIDVTDAHISWVDRKSDSDIEVTQLDLATEAIQLDKPFDFRASFNVNSRSFQVDSDITASGSLSVDLASNSYSLKNFDVNTASQTNGLPFDVLDADMSGDLLLNLKAQTFDLTNLQATIEGLPFGGELHGTGVLDTPSFFGKFSSEVFNAADVLRELGSELPADFDQTLLSDTKFKLAFQQTEEQILINGLRLSIADAELGGDFQISNLAQSPVVSGRIASNVFKPAPWMSLLGWNAADPLVMQRAQVEMAVRQSGQILSLHELQVMLDDFTLSGNIEVTDIYADTPPLVFELHGTQLDLERYAPAVVLTNEDTSAQMDGDDPLPVEKLKALDINGSIAFDELNVAGLTMTDIAVPFTAAEGNLDVAEAKAVLYGGTLFNSASIDLNGEEPLLQWSSNLSAVQADALLGDYLKSESPMSGSAIVNIDMITRGVNRTQWLQAADGTVSVRFADGAIRGINIAREIRRAHALLIGEQFNAVENNSTDFSELSISGEINDGKLFSEDLSLKAPLLRITGQGGVDLSSKYLDYVATVLVTGSVEGQGGLDMGALNGLKLLVPIKGELSEVSVDYSRVLINALTSDFNNQFESQKESLISTVEKAAETQQQRAEELLQEKVESAEILLEENKEVVIEQIQEKKNDVEREVEEKANELQQSIEKGISDLLNK